MTRSFGQRAIMEAANASDGLPPIQVEDFKAINKESFSLILSSLNTSVPYKQEDYHTALASTTNEKLGLVSGSMFNIPGFRNPTFRCIAIANRESVPYSQDEMKKRGMHTTVANLVEDNNGGMWKIVSNGDSKHIVQVTQDNHAELLAKRRARAQMTASLDNADLNIAYDDSDYVYFYNPKIEAMDYGFAVKSGRENFVVSKQLRASVKVDPCQILEAASTDGYGLNFAAKRKEMQAASSGNAFAEWIKYLRDLYGRNSEYVRAWTQAIQNSPVMIK